MLGIKDKVKHDIGEYLEGKIDILTATTKVETVENYILSVLRETRSWT